MSAVTSSTSSSTNPSIRLLITGGTGYLGSTLIHQLLTKKLLSTSFTLAYTYNTSTPLNIPKEHGQVLAIQCDLSTCTTLSTLVTHIHPTHIIHTAALCNTGICEKEPEKSYQVNVDGTRVLVEAIEEYNNKNEHPCHLLHLSTDWVYDGTGCMIKEDADTPGFGVYGKSKVGAEQVIQKSKLKQWTIFRSALMYGPTAPYSGKTSFLKWIFTSILSSSPLTLFSDEYRTPIYIDDVIRVLVTCMSKGDDVYGKIYNMGGSTRASRYEMGLTIFDLLLPTHPTLSRSSITGATLESLNLSSSRPHDLSMDSSALCHVMAVEKLTSFEEGVRATWEQEEMIEKEKEKKG